MKTTTHSQSLAFTLLEALISCTIATVVGAGVFEIILTTATLSAKNEAIDRTHEGLRKSLDHLSHELQAANNLPTLIDTTGATVTTGPSAGLYYDRLIGAPYPLTPATTAGSVSAADTTLEVTISSGRPTSPPIPSNNDCLLFPAGNGVVRARVNSISAFPASGNTQNVVCGLTTPLGQALTWPSGQSQWATLVHQQAFIVMPNAVTGRNELRFYPNYETKPSLNDPKSYAMLTDEISTQAGESTPFNVLNNNGDCIVQADLRLLNPNYSLWMSNKQNNSYNTYFRQTLDLSSRLRPKTTN